MTFTSSSSEAFRNSTSPLTQAASIRNSNKKRMKKSPFAKLKKAFGVDSTSTNSNSKHQQDLQVSPSSNSYAPLNGVVGSPMSMSSLNGGQIAAAAVVASDGAVVRGGDVMVVSV
jgi:hypothetical protein